MRRRIISAITVIMMLLTVFALPMPVAADTSNISESDIIYKVDGGNIYFDKTTGSVTGCDQTVTAANIPAKISDVDVKSIGMRAFDSCTNLTSVRIPNGIVSIGQEAFDHCEKLTNIEVPQSVIEIGADAFRDCYLMDEIVVDSNNGKYLSENGVLFNKDKSELIQYPDAKSDTSYIVPEGVTNIDPYAFGYCKKLTEITIPNTVVTIGRGAFVACFGLTSVKIPDSVTSIGAYAFDACNHMTSIEISNSITEIPPNMLSQCPIKELNIPESVKTIRSGAFEYCQSLVTVNIPESVTTIDHSAFSHCTCLEKIIIPKTVTEIGNGTFKGCNRLYIYGEAGSYAETYASANGLTFKDIAEGLPTDPTEPTDPVEPPVVEKQEQTISVQSSFNKTYGDAAFNLEASAQTSLTYKSNNTDVADVVADGKVTIKSSGTAKITIIAAETEDYKSVSKEVTINVAKASQPDYTGETTYNKTYGCAPFTVDVPTKTSLTFTSNNSGVAAVEKTSATSAKITVRSSGAATITATAAESGNYKGKEYKITVNVAKAAQAISVPKTSYTKTYGCVPFALGATAKTGLTYKSNNIDVATVTADGTVSIKAGGTATITITAAETDKYKKATKIVAITANKASQSITCSSSFSKTFGYNYYFYLGAKSKTKKAYKSSNKNIAIVYSTGKVVMKNPGKVTITITAASSDKYKSATKKVYFTSSLKRPGLTARAYSGRKIKLTWTKVPGAHGYKVYQYCYSKTKKKYIWKLVQTKGASVKSVTNKGLTSGKTYKYKVRAYRKVSGKTVYSPYSYIRKAKARR